MQTVCLEDNILRAEQTYVCPGAELQFNVPSPSGAATWTPATYLDDATSASPVVTPPDGLTEPLVYIATYEDNCGVDILDTIQLNVEVMTVEVLGVEDLTCLNNEVNLSSSSNFPGPFSHGWIAQVGAIKPWAVRRRSMCPAPTPCSSPTKTDCVRRRPARHRVGHGYLHWGLPRGRLPDCVTRPSH